MTTGTRHHSGEVSVGMNHLGPHPPQAARGLQDLARIVAAQPKDPHVGPRRLDFRSQRAPSAGADHLDLEPAPVDVAGQGLYNPFQPAHAQVFHQVDHATGAHRAPPATGSRWPGAFPARSGGQSG